MVISIHDPGALPAQLQPGWGAVLRLAFHDKEDLTLARATGLWTVFSETQARQCLRFVDEHRSKVGLLVHCTAGASRSPAIARAVCKFLGLRPDADWPTGNQLVIAVMAEAATALQERRDLMV